MAYLSLTDTEQRTAFFRASALRNLHYWQARLTTNTDLLPPEEHNNLLRAVKMALPLDEAWPLLYDIVTGVSPLLERRGRWEAGHWAISHALEAARRRHDSAAEVTLSALTARLLFQQSRYPESVRAYRRVIRLARRIGDKFNEARACTNLGYHFAEQGYWYRAEVLCCYALDLFEQIDSNHGRAHTENHLGILYTRQHRWQEAQQHLEQACNIWQTMGDEHGLMRGYLNIGLLHVDAKQPDQALDYLEMALRQTQLTREKITIGRVYLNMGKAFRLLLDWSQAEVYTKEAESIFEACSDLTELSRTWNGLGLIYFHQRRWGEANLYLEKSLNLWRRLGIKFEEIEVLLDIGECEMWQGYYVQAAERLREVEQQIGLTSEQGPYRHLWPRLNQYRHDLDESLGEKRAASLGGCEV